MGEEGELPSSRVYVAGLPAYLDEKRLRDVFGERGDVTDARVLMTKDGRSRQFGFVGFKSVEQAKDAIHYFNNSYIDTSRISVKFAEKSQSSNLQRPWSVHSEGSSRYAKRKQIEQAGEEDSKAAGLLKKRKTKTQLQKENPEDPQLQEFLRIMQPRSKAAVWANDDAVPGAARQAGKGVKLEARGQRGAAQAAANAGTDEEDEAEADADYQDLADVKKVKKGRVHTQADEETSPSQHGSRQIDALVADNDVSDLDYLKARMKDLIPEDETEADGERGESESEELDEEDGQSEEEESDNPAHDSEGSEDTGIQPDLEDGKAEEERLYDRQHSHHHSTTSGKGVAEDDKVSVSKTGRLFLRNLSYQATEAELAALFEEYGDLSEVHLIVERATNRSKGIALIQFLEPEDAAAAFAALDGSIFQGRLLHILPAKPSPQNQAAELESEAGDGDKPTNFKRQKECKQRASAGNRAAWNSLFMRADTVAEAVAAHYGISKSQLLDKEAADLPVRMALGEAHVIALTKSRLAEAGVNVQALESAAAASGKAAGGQAGPDRSSTALVIKNLPYSSTEADLMEVFGGAGLVSRLVLPETKTLAIVEYQRPAEARHAFKTLAFKRFQTAPLFLEWAPKDIFSGSPLNIEKQLRFSWQPLIADRNVYKLLWSLSHTAYQQADEPALSPFSPAQVANPAEIDKIREIDPSEASHVKATDEDIESRSIYVKNLSWSTKDANLIKHFDATVSASGGSIRSARVAQRKGPDGKLLSAGFGFVECSTEAAARSAIQKLQGSMLNGHRLKLQLSTKKGQSHPAAKDVGTKGDANAKSTKIVVRNVAFEATAKDLRALFQPFGQIKSVRLPKKFQNSHRGFAFLDFLSHQEAENAMESVAGTHLYGRRLVTEWAAQDEGLDELRLKTAAKFQGSHQ